MNLTKNVMVINLGLKSIRCIIFDQNGMKLGSAAIAVHTAVNDTYVEQDVTQWTNNAIKVMQTALKESRVSRIDFITVTTSASCLVCIDENGNPLCRALMVSDKRAKREVNEINAMPEFQSVRDKTGLDMSVSLMLPKILWIKNNRPEVFEKTAFFLSPNDFLINFLSGKVVTDELNALKYHYILSQQSYPEALLKQLGIPLTKLPKVDIVGSKVGTIRKEFAEAVNINNDIQVIISSYDAICSFIGSGVSDEGEASDVSGTVTVLRTISRKNNLKSSKRVYVTPFRNNEFQIVGGSNNLGGGLIEWVKQCYYQREEFPYEVMEKDARESEVGAKGLIFLPYLLGERTPIWNDEARGVFFGLERMHTRIDMTRAVFESTGFIDLDISEAIRETGAEVNSVRLSGGLARLQLISQIKADILGMDVMVLSEFETTASGAAMIALSGESGVYSNLKEAADKFAAIRMIIKPDIENHKKYKYMYELYRETYEAMKPIYSRRMEVLAQIRKERDIQIENL
ncbi:MAG: hypothetical protein IJ563_04585 [Selenomonadaceae bacterium]|nr:hypothetical protein [Selenomonadaceae bacterium]